MKALLVAVVFVLMSFVSVANEGEVEKALSAAKNRVKESTAIIKENPKNAQAYADRAAAKTELGNVFGAIKDYNAALHIEPGNVLYLQNRGNAFLMIDAFKEALDDFNTALKTTNSVELVYDRAVAKFHAGDAEGSLADLNQVVSIDSLHSKALYNRAVVKMDLDQTESAMEDLNVFLQQNPNHAQALLALEIARQKSEKRAKR